MSKKNLIIFLTLFFSLFGIYHIYGFTLPRWFPFNRKDALNEWEEKIFRNKVLYSVEIKQNNGYLAAKSNKAASGLVYKIRFKVQRYPMMSWKWKVIQFPDKRKKSDDKGGWIEKDDYAARVYVIFNSLNFMNIKAVEYVWEENIPEGTILTSPYSRNIKIFVLETGKKNAGQWVMEERNINDDYIKAFGRVP